MVPRGSRTLFIDLQNAPEAKAGIHGERCQTAGISRPRGPRQSRFSSAACGRRLSALCQTRCGSTQEILDFLQADL